MSVNPFTLWILISLSIVLLIICATWWDYNLQVAELVDASSEPAANETKPGYRRDSWRQHRGRINFGFESRPANFAEQQRGTVEARRLNSRRSLLSPGLASTVKEPLCNSFRTLFAVNHNVL